MTLNKKINLNNVFYEPSGFMSDIFVKIVQRMKKRETTQQQTNAKTQSATAKHSNAHESNHVRHVKKL